MSLSDEKFFRALVRVETILEDKGVVQVVVPAWDSDHVFSLKHKELPDEIWAAILEGQIRFHAEVTLGVETPGNMKFKDWEAR